ncbi:72 kDa inositol polyphosphate 5-phosphatase [Strongyloides ratti]|uniref:72 kDa inositol polyphosphate 5-phosphatase n=1 Tax=Strongyloides ratti TaxID=34506 RepID=A0A090MRL8_STRRB|nr:72 kDa inositol polyphosphate 5-phosphatase [Strongyloides ratti]CEF60878.1 72 kDa inositol polyphosphate 5-phosphatase [Strongyloides ratti]
MTYSLQNYSLFSDEDQKLTLLGPGNVKIPTKEEFNALTEFGHIKVMCYTWNIAERRQSSVDAICHSFSSIPLKDRPHIIGISLQELPPSDRTFHLNIVKQLTLLFKNTHFMLSWVRRWSQIQIIMVKNNMKKFIVSFNYKWIPCKVLSKPIRTKGCIATFVKILHLSCVFISCHFSHENIKERNKNSKKIYDLLVKDNEYSKTTDCYFLFGDMNYRLQITWDNDLCKKFLHYSLLSTATKQKTIGKMLEEYDELLKEINKCEIFQGFKEPKINFLPSYKYIPFTDKFNMNRVIAYTDRVLYMDKCKNLITPYRYDSLHACKVSDHKPVYAIFMLNLKNSQATHS